MSALPPLVRLDPILLQNPQDEYLPTHFTLPLTPAFHTQRYSPLPQQSLKERIEEERKSARRLSEKIARRRDMSPDTELARTEWMTQETMGQWKEKPHIFDMYRMMNQAQQPAPGLVTTLYLPNSELYKSVPEHMSKFTNLTQINLSENRIDLANLKGLPAVIRLNLAGNQMKDIGDLEGGFPKLQILDLSFNEISENSLANLWTLPLLSNLDVSYNRITTLDPTVQLGPSMEALNLEANPLVSDPTDIFEAISRSHIRTLDLSNTEIHHLRTPKRLEIERLYVHHTPLSSSKVLPLDNWDCLKEIYLAETPLMLSAFPELNNHGALSDAIAVIEKRGVRVMDSLRPPVKASNTVINTTPLPNVQTIKSIHPELFANVVHTKQKWKPTKVVSLEQRKLNKILETRQASLLRERNTETLEHQLDDEWMKDPSEKFMSLINLAAEPKEEPIGQATFLTALEFKETGEYLDMTYPGSIAAGIRALRRAVETSGRIYWRDARVRDKFDINVSHASPKVEHHFNGPHPESQRTKRMDDAFGNILGYVGIQDGLDSLEQRVTQLRGHIDTLKAMQVPEKCETIIQTRDEIELQALAGLSPSQPT